MEERSILRAGWRAWQEGKTEWKARARVWNDMSGQGRATCGRSKHDMAGAGVDSARGRTGAGAGARTGIGAEQGWAGLGWAGWTGLGWAGLGRAGQGRGRGWGKGRGRGRGWGKGRDIAGKRRITQNSMH